MWRLRQIPLLVAIALLPGRSVSGDEKPKTPSTKEAWKSLFDGKSLNGWKSAGYIESGKVYVRDGAIVMEKGARMTGVTYQGKDFLKLDYEVAFEGKKIDGDDFFCTATFPVGDSFCSLVAGGWGGQVVGLSNLNHLDASENETATGKEFKKDQWYKFRIRVTKNRIQAWIDKDQVINVDTTDKKVHIRFECDNCKPFGFCTWDTVGAVRDIRVRPLTEDEKRVADSK